jgi:putative peptidoglycan lipid II flippase
MTLLSRITGLARESLKATVFGAGVQMDAFEAAFRLPNILRRMFAEGAFSQAFVPVLSEYHRQRGAEATRDFVGRVGSLLALVLLGVTILGVLAAPWLVYLLASGFAKTPGKVELTAQMIRIVFPYVLFISLVWQGACSMSTAVSRFPRSRRCSSTSRSSAPPSSSRASSTRRSWRSRGACSSGASRSSRCRSRRS